MLAVPREQFVSTDAGEQHLHVGARLPTDQVRGDHGGIRDGLVHLPDQPREELDHAGLHHDLPVEGTEAAGDSPGYRGIVERALADAVPLREGDREGAHQLCARLGHERYDRGRVHPGREEGAQRHVAHHLLAHGRAQPFAHTAHYFRIVTLPHLPLRRRHDLPVLAHAEVTAAEGLLSPTHSASVNSIRFQYS